MSNPEAPTRTPCALCGAEASTNRWLTDGERAWCCPDHRQASERWDLTELEPAATGPFTDAWIDQDPDAMREAILRSGLREAAVTIMFLGTIITGGQRPNTYGKFRFVTPDGQPIADAEVASWQWLTRQLLAAIIAFDPQTLRSVMTTADDRDMPRALTVLINAAVTATAHIKGETE